MCVANATTHNSTIYWRSFESKLTKLISPLNPPPIELNKTIYIPRLANIILDSGPYEIKNEKSSLNQSITVEENFSLNKELSKNRIQVQVISSVPIYKIINIKKNSAFSIQNESQNLDSIIIHIHGGGFMCSSSFYCEPFTISYSNALKVPIFSIDYRLTPENKFPAGLDDVWQAYFWIVTYAQKYLGIEPRKIVLTGESAGGNLVTALTLKAITSGFRVPDGILLSYPYLNVQDKYFSTGILLSLEDKDIDYTLIPIMRLNYVEKPFSAEDYLISPLFTPREILEQFPKTEIMLGLNDPLANDTLRFADKLLSADVNVKITEYPGVPHGCLGDARKNLVPSYLKILENNCESLRRLLS